MYLQKVDIEGFKSFANKTTMTFDRGITSVVGPNGSGKSNVADAIRWALGETSAKSVRSKKSDDVIFSGSKKARGGNFAEVTLTLNNEDGKIPLEYNNVAITRHIQKSGDSSYYINNNQVRLRDIHDLLLKAGFGQKTYSVIKQGTIEAILLASPAERKIMFDEATGVREYQVKKNRAVRDLDTTKQNLEHVGDLLTELTPRVKSLKRQADRASQREAVEKELKQKLYLYYGQRFINNQREFDLAAKASHEAEQKLRVLQNTIKEKERLLDGRHQNPLQEKRETLEKTISEATKQSFELERQVIVLKGRLQMAREQQGNYDHITTNKRLEEITGNLAELTRTEKQQKEALHKATQIVAKISQSVVSAEIKLQELQTKFSSQTSVGSTLKPRFLATELRSLGSHHQELKQAIGKGQAASFLMTILDKALATAKKVSELVSRAETAEKSLPIDPEELKRLQKETQTLRAKAEAARVAQAVSQSKLEDITENLQALAKDQKILQAKQQQEQQDGHAVAQEKELAAAENELAKEKTTQERLRQEKKYLEAKIAAEQSDFLVAERAYRTLQDELFAQKDAQSKVEVELVRIETHREDILGDAREDISPELITRLTTLTKEKSAELLTAATAVPTLSNDILKLKSKAEQIGAIDPETMREYQETSARFEHLTTQSEDLKTASEKLKGVVKKLETDIDKQFGKTFMLINTQFERYFKILFNGGHAKLTLVKFDKSFGLDTAPEEAEESQKKREVTIEITAVPPGKKVENISMLSGGEKSMTALALLYAIITVNPSPFVVLDEADAALDESNSKRFSKILHNLSDHTQFVLITHNRETMRQAQTLYGVTMNDSGMSKVLSVKLEEAEALADKKKVITKPTQS